MGCIIFQIEALYMLYLDLGFIGSYLEKWEDFFNVMHFISKQPYEKSIEALCLRARFHFRFGVLSQFYNIFIYV